MMLINPFFGKSSPLFSALYHFNSDFSDSSTNAYHLTGDAIISSTQSKFGGSSAYFDGTTSLSSVTDAFPIPTGDFTIEFWAYYTGVGSGYEYLTMLANIAEGVLSNRIAIRLADAGFGNALQGELKGGSAAHVLGTTETKTTMLNRWAAIAIVRSGSLTILYVDGTAVNSNLNTITYTNNMTLLVGAYLGFNYIGYIDELRISDVARYTSNYTPATSPF